MDKIKIKKLNQNAVLPSRGTSFSAGLDLSACIETDVEIKPNETKKIGTGIAIELEQNTVGLVFGRSGLGVKFGITLANCVGVIDSDYRGEIIVGLHNSSTESYTIKAGERIAQLVVVPIFLPEVVEVETLDETKRGENGFGSTGRL